MPSARFEASALALELLDPGSVPLVRLFRPARHTEGDWQAPEPEYRTLGQWAENIQQLRTLPGSCARTLRAVRNCRSWPELGLIPPQSVGTRLRDLASPQGNVAARDHYEQALHFPCRRSGLASIPGCKSRRRTHCALIVDAWRSGPRPIDFTGGGGRNRTGVDGFAGRCMTTLPLRPGPRHAGWETGYRDAHEAVHYM